MDNDSQDIKDQAPVQADEPARRRSPLLLVAAIVGMLLTLVAWMALMFYPSVSLGCAIGSLCLSVAALWMGRCCWRDVAITSIVASGVLILVHVVFTWGLDYALASI